MKRQISLIIMAFASLTLWAQTQRNQTLDLASSHGWEYEIRAGLTIGGTSPIPLPREIRSIDQYSPTLAFNIEANVTKWLGEQRRWGVISGLRLENKGMTTRATTKNYGMEIIGDDGNRLQGNWTGGVRMRVRNSYLTVPLLATYKLSQRVHVKAGPWFSYLIDGEFGGHVYDGYLRETNPTGDKVNFSGDAIATYDFSDDLRKLQWGLQAGADWLAFSHFKVYGDLTWGLSDIFQSDFQTITFSLYNIYLTLGFGYVF